MAIVTTGSSQSSDIPTKMSAIAQKVATASPNISRCAWFIVMTMLLLVSSAKQANQRMLAAVKARKLANVSGCVVSSVKT
jgi:hypothetical protein